MDDVAWLDETEAAAWKGLQLLQMHLDTELARQLATDSALSLPDYVVLVALTERPDRRLRPFELAATIGWDKTRLSHHVKRMTDRGLVAKEACPSDRRGAFVVATDEGVAAIASAAPGHVAAVRRLFLDHVTPDELAVIADVSARLLARFARQASAPASPESR